MKCLLRESLSCVGWEKRGRLRRWREMERHARSLERCLPPCPGAQLKAQIWATSLGGMALPEELAMNDSRSRTRLLKKWVREDSGLQPAVFLAQEPLDWPCRREYQVSLYPPAHGRQMDRPVVERQARHLIPFHPLLLWQVLVVLGGGVLYCDEQACSFRY